MGQQISAKPNTKQTTLRQNKMATPGIEMKLVDFERSNFALSPKLEITEFFCLQIGSIMRPIYDESYDILCK